MRSSARDGHISSGKESHWSTAPELSHGVHHYATADFGLTDDEIREAFGDYVVRFDLLAKGTP